MIFISTRTSVFHAIGGMELYIKQILNSLKKDPLNLEEVINCYDNLPNTIKRKEIESHLKNLDNINIKYKSDV